MSESKAQELDVDFTDTAEVRVVLREMVEVVKRLVAENAALRDLVCHAHPLAWLATRDERACSDWEVKAHGIKVEQACAQAGAGGKDPK